MSTKSPMKLHDLEALRELVEAAVDDPATRARYADWLTTAIDVRRAQKERSRVAWHREREAAYHAAVQLWEARREQVAVGHATENAEYAEGTPRPRLMDFMEGELEAPALEPRADEPCVMCGVALTPEDELLDLPSVAA